MIQFLKSQNYIQPISIYKFLNLIIHSKISFTQYIIAIKYPIPRSSIEFIYHRFHNQQNMEDIYHLNHDCINCTLNFKYQQFQYYFNIRLINKLFYLNASPILSLFIRKYNYSEAMNELNILKSLSLSSLKIKCGILSDDRWNKNIWKYYTNLQKLSFCAITSHSNMNYCRVSSKLTYLKIQCIDCVLEVKWNCFDNLRYLKLYNIMIHTTGDYYHKLTNLISLTRSFEKRACMEIDLYYEYHSNLTYLKLQNMQKVILSRMTQLKIKLLDNIPQLTIY